MDLPLHESPRDPQAQARADGRRFWRAALASAAFVALIAWIRMAESWIGHPLHALAVHPQQPLGLVGLLTAPLLHGSFDHLVANSLALLVLGTLSGVLYPRAMLRALPLIWLGSGLFVWIVGREGSAHLGASGLTHGLMFFVFLAGLWRRDRAAIAGSMIAFFLYGGMVLTVLPREPGVSWESHLGGALFGALAVLLWHRLDPAPPRRRYSWELEAEQDALEDALAAEQRGMYERRPEDVPVLWSGPTRPGDERYGTVIRFPEPRGRDGSD